MVLVDQVNTVEVLTPFSFRFSELFLKLAAPFLPWLTENILPSLTLHTWFFTIFGWFFLSVFDLLGVQIVPIINFQSCKFVFIVILVIMTLGSIALKKTIVEIFGVEGCGVFNFAFGSLVVKGKDSLKIENSSCVKKQKCFLSNQWNVLLTST